jgi:hypothetical protein
MEKKEKYDAILVVCGENCLNSGIKESIRDRVCLLSKEYRCPVIFPSSLESYGLISRPYPWYVLSGDYLKYIKGVKEIANFKSFLVIADPKEMENHLLDLKNKGFEAVAYDKLEELYALKVS